MGFASWDQVEIADDILLSCASSKPPRVHDLGELTLCRTYNAPGVALGAEAGFDARRNAVMARLVELGRMHTFAPEPAG